jgi:hypothetical protein
LRIFLTCFGGARFAEAGTAAHLGTYAVTCIRASPSESSSSVEILQPFELPISGRIFFVEIVVARARILGIYTRHGVTVGVVDIVFSWARRCRRLFGEQQWVTRP